MEVLEIVLLMIAYSVIILALFMELICYKRNMEFIETIYFTVALLLLIISLTADAFLVPVPVTNFSTLLCMILIGLTTPLNALAERKHNVPLRYKKLLVVVSISLALLVVAGYFLNILDKLQYLVVVFMGSAVVLSMVLVKNTSPRFQVAHQEKTDRYFANIWLVFMPLLLMADYISTLNHIGTKIGFTLPVVFIMLAGNKLWNDVKRLSLFKPDVTTKEQNLRNYALTKREQEVALLLLKGHTYKQVAEQLFISMPTVKTHASNIYKKCGVNSKTELVVLISH
ncbi:LuxR C-terminal-related transcriptional regulator [uncultured Microscilla sp.]|uniref:response regulator transcription factor n=1 Tax=uncultured Microscilla sp. TaxID=432653 RepID=UPI00261F96D1|nr:LuxR C-terminal-related transcriptional regulator [uncultured Microscilla sp.]